MATLKTYITRMRTTQNKVCVKLGCDLSRESVPLRAVGTSGLAVLAVLVKALVDKGLITDQELNAALTSAEDDLYDIEPQQP